MPKYLNRICVLAVLGLVSVSVGPHQHAVADAELQHRDLFDLLEARQDSAIENGVGRIWMDDLHPAVNSIVVQPYSNGVFGKGSFLCSSFLDSTCSSSSPKKAQVTTVLGICESEIELGCIEAVAYKNNFLSEAHLKQVATPITVRDEVSSLNIPRGSAMSLWEASDGSRFVVSVLVNSELETSGRSWSRAMSRISLSIVRVKRDFSVHEAKAEMRTDLPSSAGKPVLWFSGGIPGPTLEFDSGSFFKLSVRVPKDVGGFFRGRIANALVESNATSPQSITYVIQGEVLPVYIAGAEATADNSIAFRNGEKVTGYRRTKAFSYYLEDYATWKSFISERALTTRGYWGVASSTTNEQRCFDSAKKINGLVSSNASFYSASPPSFNATTGTFDYKVASPHFDEMGNVAVGMYSLAIPVSVLQCLYGSNAVPGTAEITINYGDGKPIQTLTQKVTVVGDWANVSVGGLHFSSPVIRAKFKVPYRTTISKGKTLSLGTLAKTKVSQRPRWSASGPCKVSGAKLVAMNKSGTCKVTLRVLNSKNKYVLSLKRSLKVS